MGGHARIYITRRACSSFSTRHPPGRRICMPGMQGCAPGIILFRPRGCREHLLSTSLTDGGVVTSSLDSTRNTANDLRLIGEKLLSISRHLHEHARKLEIAVEGRYGKEMDNPRVALLNESLNISRFADLELSKLDRSLQSLALKLQTQPLPLLNGGSHPVPSLKFEREREALATSISHLEQERNELGILYDIARTLN